MVIVVMGRFLSNRFFKASGFIKFPRSFRVALRSRNDPNDVVFPLNEDNIK